jgi:hypothetical protein
LIQNAQTLHAHIIPAICRYFFLVAPPTKRQLNIAIS